jgi:hypothetical protein
MADPDETNDPKLLDVEPPFTPGQPPKGTLEILKLYPKLFDYVRKYGLFVIPKSVDQWQYRGLLHALDGVCLHALKSQGALSSPQLRAQINRKGAVRTNPEKTGISTVSPRTCMDWIELAQRRGLVTAWPEPSSQFSYWAITERGLSARGSRLPAIASRIPTGSILTLLVGGGGALAAVKWLQTHASVLKLVLVALAVILYIGAVFGGALYFRKRLGPGNSVVVIETLRSGRRPLPSLDGI